MMLRDYESEKVEHAIGVLRSGGRQLYVAPCGSGKSYIELGILRRLPVVIISPRLEVIRGLWEKDCRGSFSRAAAEAAGLWTSKRLWNVLMYGGTGPSVQGIVIDEAHHSPMSTQRDIESLMGHPPAVGFTATPYRGTVEGTRELREQWGEPDIILSLRECRDRGYISIPQMTTIALVDDDEIDIVGGEFRVSQVEGSTPMDQVVELIEDMRNGLPSCAVCASKRMARELASRFSDGHLVLGDTPWRERMRAFHEVVHHAGLLISVRVLGEGVDLPIRRLFDLSPCWSPVRWMQQLGRVMRPGGSPRYFCTNRNIIRHGYLLDGLIPVSDLRQAESSFSPSRRSGVRAVGFEGVGRFRPDRFPLANGLTGTMYAVTDGSTEYCAVAVPHCAEVLWARRPRRGRWTAIPVPDGLHGFVSIRSYSMTEKQRAWWKRSARHFGLDPGADVTSRQFQILPLLANLGIKIRE